MRKWVFHMDTKASPRSTPPPLPLCLPLPPSLPHSLSQPPPDPPLSPSAIHPSLPTPTPTPNPTSILIIGSGVFGLATALSLAHHDSFTGSTITVLDRSPNQGVFPATDAASIDSSRVIRSDYADPLYANLAAEAQLHWRQKNSPSDLGCAGNYNECGLIVATAAATSDNHGFNRDYAVASWRNAQTLAAAAGTPEAVRELPDPRAISERLRTGGCTGTWGYVNETSGWADAEASMRWLLAAVKATARVRFVQGKAVSLRTDGSVVTGALLQDDTIIKADLTIVAAGAWTGSLVDIAGRVTATAQVLAYLPITPDEEDRLSSMPVVVDISSGYFIIPPSKGILKVARHAYGYQNIMAANPLPLSTSQERPTATTASLPVTSLDHSELGIPPAEEEGLRAALCRMVLLDKIASRPFSKARLCWYSDTSTGDFLVDYHPGWRGLFIATGDSGHAFKFLPVLGDRIVECVLGTAADPLRRQWGWKRPNIHDGVAGDTRVMTNDGSRGGSPASLGEHMTLPAGPGNTG